MKEPSLDAKAVNQAANMDEYQHLTKIHLAKAGKRVLLFTRLKGVAFQEATGDEFRMLRYGGFRVPDLYAGAWWITLNTKDEAVSNEGVFWGVWLRWVD